MIFRLANWAVMGIAIFYLAEGTGVVPRGAYFPTLPRLEESARDPAAWFGAVQWGFSRLASGQSNGGSSGNTFSAQDWLRENGRDFSKVAGYYGS
ncbi:MAG: hypothetical protein ACK5YK_01910 [Pseudomonadota bacterium]|jgi:hypothetical protein